MADILPLTIACGYVCFERDFLNLPVSTLNVTIDPASWRDLNPVRHLEQICFPKDAWPIFDMLAVMAFPSIVRLKANLHLPEQNPLLVGFVAGDIRRDEGISWIATIAVLPEYQGHGIGRRLLTACETLLPTRSIRLCVRQTNAVAIQLYLSTGYRKISVWPQYYVDREDALVMEKIH